MSDAACCHRCRGPVERDARFCRHCGEPLGAAPFGRLALALAGDGTDEGERHVAGEHKQVTVLFADIQGSMALVEQIEPEDWHSIVGGLFSVLGEAVRCCGGIVSRFTGDGLMALFGVPVAHEDHARRGCHAALQAREAILSYADQVRRRHGVGFSVRIGLHSGHVVAATIGDDLECGYTAVGETINLGERMERLAGPGCIFVTEDTAALVGGLFDLRDLGHFELKPRPHPVRVYELRGWGTHVTRLDVSRSRGFSPFVGRWEEISRLESALERVMAGTGQIIEIVGEAGVGKSRLCHEFLEDCRERGLRVHAWHGFAHLSDTPFLAFVEGVRRALGLGPDDSESEVRAAVERRLLAIDGRLAEFVPLLADLLSARRPPGGTWRWQGRPLQREITRLVEQFALLASANGPAVVLIEDLHWIDRGWADLLDAYLEAIRSARILALLTFRPEYHAGPAAWRAADRIEVAPLSLRQAAALVRDLLGPGPSVRPLAKQIRARARGNPFFTEELVWSLAESGVLEGERGAFRLARPVGEAVLPATIQATLAARIDRLRPVEKAMLQTAAVIGRGFSGRLLEQVALRSPAEVGEVIQALLDRGFFARDEGAGEDRYRFLHPLMHEEAYYSQLSEVRRRAHAKVARVLVALDPELLDQRAALIGHHWFAAGERLEAARWLRRAAAWLSTHNLADAAGQWRRVRELADGFPDLEEARRLALEARIASVELGVRVGIGLEEAMRLFVEGERLAIALGEVAALARLSGAYGQVCGLAGEGSRALELSTRAVDLAGSVGHPALLHGLRAGLAFAHFSVGNFRETCRLTEETLLPWLAGDASVDRVADPLECRLLLCHALALAYTGRLERACLEAELAIAAGERLGALEVVCLGFAFTPVFAQIGGVDPTRARSLARRSVEMAEELASPFALGLAH